METLQIIEGGYLRDILDQPAALEDTLASLDSPAALSPLSERLARNEFARVVLTGMGGSLFALYPLHLQLLGRGLPAILLETSELIHFAPEILDRRTLLIAVSQSGRSAEILRLLELKSAGCLTLGVTNTPDSPLAAGSDVVVLTRAGTEMTVSCKTYVSALLALQWAGDALLGDDIARSRDELSSAGPAAALYLNRWRSHVENAAAELSGVRSLFYLGRGPSLAAAATGGLITKESARFHAEAMSSAAFRHGPFEMLDAEVFALVFEGSPHVAPLNRKLAGDIRRAGGRAALAGGQASLDAFRLPPVPARALPVCEILPVQMITLALAARAGREAGRFEKASKVTAAE